MSNSGPGRGSCRRRHVLGSGCAYARRSGLREPDAAFAVSIFKSGKGVKPIHAKVVATLMTATVRMGWMLENREGPAFRASGASVSSPGCRGGAPGPLGGNEPDRPGWQVASVSERVNQGTQRARGRGAMRRVPVAARSWPVFSSYAPAWSPDGGVLGGTSAGTSSSSLQLPDDRVSAVIAADVPDGRREERFRREIVGRRKPPEIGAGLPLDGSANIIAAFLAGLTASQALSKSCHESRGLIASEFGGLRLAPNCTKWLESGAKTWRIWKAWNHGMPLFRGFSVIPR